jgi:hypothetical protein
LDRWYQRKDLREMSTLAVRPPLPALLFFSLCTLIGPSGRAQYQQGKGEAEAFTWANGVHQVVSQQVFGSPISDSLGLDITWVVTARIRPSSDAEPEVQFVLRKTSGGEVEATLTELARPLMAQLQDLYREQDKRTSQEVAKLIEVRRFDLTGKQCSCLLRIARSFERLRTRIEVKNALILDPRQYQLWIDAGSQESYFRLLGPPSGAAMHPIIAWMEKSLRRLRGAVGEPALDSKPSRRSSCGPRRTEHRSSAAPRRIGPGAGGLPDRPGDGRHRGGSVRHGRRQ